MIVKEGMYIRTKINDFCNMVAIRKIDEIDDDGSFWIDDYIIDTYGDEQNKLHEEDIELASDNLIDLIEVGDYVNGQPIGEVTLSGYYKAVCINYFYKNQRKKIYLESKDIKSIVTKEQYESMKYRVG